MTDKHSKRGGPTDPHQQRERDLKNLAESNSYTYTLHNPMNGTNTNTF